MVRCPVCETTDHVGPYRPERAVLDAYDRLIAAMQRGENEYILHILRGRCERAEQNAIRHTDALLSLIDAHLAKSRPATADTQTDGQEAAGHG